jgi:putative ABC transport system permease protein
MRAHDLTLAFRNLFQRPLFAATAIVLMALAAGANAAVFSVVRGVLLKPLPYAQPERLAAFWPGSFVSNEEIAYWRERTRSFEELAAVSPGWLMALVADGYEPLKVTGGRTSDNFFTTLGVGAAIGRTVQPGDSTPGRARVVVLSHEIFERHFAGNPAVLGRFVHLDGAPHEIIGVMPRGFEFMGPGTDVWAPLPFDPTATNHRATFSQAFARLRPGTSPEAATTEVVALTESMRRDLGKPNDWGKTLTVASLQKTIASEFETSLLIILGAVGLILLLAAVNLGTLVLSRSIERAREMAVRTALGASRLRLIKQLVVEQLVLTACGALAGLIVARAALPVLVSRIPPDIPRQHDIALDAVVFGAVFAISVGLALAFALMPIVLIARPELQPLLRQTHSTEPKSRRRALGALVAAQIALAIVLGIGAGLMLRSLWNLQQVDPGFKPDGVLTFRLQTTSKYDALSTGLPYMEQVVERLRALPSVTNVGSIQHLPMSGYNWTSQVYPIERPPAPGATPPTVTWRFTGWQYFETLGIPLRAGRLFTALDTTPAPGVAIVNEALALREYGSANAAIGRHLRLTSGRGAEQVEVVGVTGNVRYLSLDTPARPEIYRPLAQTFMFPMAFVVRTAGDPAQLAAAVRQAAYTVDPTVPVAELQPMRALLAQTLARASLLTTLLGVFASAGLLLTIVGVYGVVAYWVRQREREFGIRLALGAAPTRIARGILRQGAIYAAAGIAIALPAAWLLSRVMQSTVYGITARDPLTFITLPVTVLVVTLAAAYFPARRAARVDPVTTMKAQ